MSKGVKRVDKIDQLMKTAAKRQFVSAAANMGWQLGLAVIIPVFMGVKLDDRFNTEPSYTLAALFLAAAGACYIVWQNINQVNKQQRAKKP